MLENVFNKDLSMKSNMSRFPNTREKLKFTQITRQYTEAVRVRLF